MNLRNLAFCLVSVLFCSVRATDFESSEDQVPLTSEYKFHRKLVHGISDPGSPWITGPGNKKYQFHIGRQSWVGAREHCLGQNSDLVTINSKEELDWILAHYEPQFANLNERLVQIGLFIDSHDGHREWHWVNHKTLDTAILPWVSGEPFDHTEGRERCAVLRVNENRVDDVDCDLSGSMTKMYRFVCERTHEEHVKHEEINNPLWKKLQDILDFFGISGGNKEENEKSTPRPGEDEEDYWENVKSEKPTTKPIEEENQPSSAIPNTEDIEGSGEQVIPEKENLEKPVVIQAAKTIEKNVIEDELIIDKNLEKLGEDKDSLKVEEKEPKEVSPEIPAVETQKLESAEKIETQKPESLEKIETKKPESLEKTETQKLESSEKIEKEVPKTKKNGYIDVLERNMEKLEKIVDAVEKMIDPVDGLKVVDAESSEAGITSKENKDAKEVGFDDSTEFTAPVFGTYHPRAPHRFQENRDELDAVDGIMLGMLNHFLNFNRMALMGKSTKDKTQHSDNKHVESMMITEESDENVQESIKAMEEDFKEAEEQNKAHPGVNISDPSIPKTHQENIELCESEEDLKKEKVGEFLKTLVKFLHESTPQDLTSFLENNNFNGPSLLKKLDEAIAKATGKQAEEMLELKKELNKSLLDKKENTAVINGTNEEKKPINQELPEQKTEEKINESEKENKNEAEKTTTQVTNILTDKKPELDKSTTTPGSIEEVPIVGNKPEVSNNEKKEEEEEEGYEVQVNLYLNDKKNTTNDSVNEDPKIEDTTAQSSTTKDEIPESEEEEETTTDGEKAVIELKKENEEKKVEEKEDVKPEIEKPEKKEKKVEKEEKKSKKEEKEVEKEEKKSEKEETKTKKEKARKNKKQKSRADRLVEGEKEDESVFPLPDFSKVKPGDKIPEEVQEALKEEKKKVDAAYKEFNKRIDTSGLIKQIEEAEKKRLGQMSSMPLNMMSGIQAPQNNEVGNAAMRELEKMFEDLGRNFRTLVQG